jgi:serine phosphatase RsbU (regulator of sigma subunit)
VSGPIHDGPVTDPVAALATVAAALERLGVVAEQRAGLLVTVARALRERHPGARLSLTGDGASLRATIGGAGGPDRTATAPIAARPDGGGDDATGLLDVIIDQYDALEWYRQELDRTDQGVLALHAELDDSTEQLRQAGDLQRRLLNAERAAHAAAEASRARLAFLAHAGATLAASLDHEQILGHLHAIVVPRHAAAMTVWLVRETGPLVPLPPESTTGPPPPLVEKAYARGIAQHATRLPRDDDVAPGVETMLDAHQLLAIPLISRGATLGVLAAEPPSGSFTAEDVAVFTELARVTAVATDNALRYEHERDVADILQRAMLTDLPAHGRLRWFTARYLPAEAALNVGGDWYDAFERPDGDVMAVVGDVTGHGLQAAALMGQLRTTLRAYAVDAEGPGDVLTRMHRLLSHLQPDDLATAVLAQISPGGLLRWSNAGHPPPLLRTPDGTVTALQDHDFLLGMPLEGAALREFGVRPEPGSVVLFYTDGLIERRGVPLGESIDRLARAFARAPGGLDAIADRVLTEMLRDSAREDDTCLLVFQIVAP